LQYFRSNHHLLCARFARLRCEGHANGVANPFLQQD
jgi:hypothetical protein